MNILDNLPTKIKQSVLRWYYISSILLLGTIITLTGITLWYSTYKPYIPQELPVQVEDHSKELAAIMQSHTLLETAEHFIRLLDPEIELAKLTVHNNGTITATGTVPNSHNLAQSVALLEKHFNITEITTHEQNFTLCVKINNIGSS